MPAIIRTFTRNIYALYTIFPNDASSNLHFFSIFLPYCLIGMYWKKTDEQ